MNPSNELKFLFLTWDDVQRLSEIASDKIKETGFTPDVIVAVSRGGFDPARILSDQLGVRNLASVQVVYYKGVNERNETPEVQYHLNADVKDQKVLVVDDVADSGNSLRVVKEHVEKLGAETVKIVTLHHKPWSIFKPDYFADEVEKWIIYPWELRESLIDLKQMFLDKGVPEEKLSMKLMEIGFSAEQIQRYLGIIVEDV
ncbi:MAG: phosphoribosyltransferase [Candidatus Bathyarchaeota archaeon]|nr:phosphoribosyltransferase [Candidatus Bathyarchaeota archaeon]